MSRADKHNPIPGPRRSLDALARRRSVGVSVLVALVLAGVLASWLGARAVARTDAEKGRLAFHLASAEIASTLKQAIQHEEDLVISASAFSTSDPDASPAQFDRWAESVDAMQRYPELQNIGLVKFVPRSQLASFEAYLAANPVRPLGPDSVAPVPGFQILPPGTRPYYCFAVAGLARNTTTYLPAGVDYCVLSPQLILDREDGQTGYAPVTEGPAPLLGVETPVYRGGGVPSTAAARRQNFVGWLGELVMPEVVLESALEGHPGIAVDFRYESRFSNVAFSRGKMPHGAQSTKIALLVGREALGNAHEGWTVQTYGAPAAAGLFSNENAVLLLAGGTLLSVLLGLLVYVLATGRMRAMSLVRQKTRELSYQATHDVLTGLPNRALVLDQARQMLARTARQPGVVAGALFIDFDGFKHVNDKFGHAAGDQFLKTVAERLRSTVREQDTVGRLAGDEFVVLVDAPADQSTVHALADRISRSVREPVELSEGREIVSVTASTGIAIGQYATPDDLLRDADLALYAAKAGGKDRYLLFEPSMASAAGGRSELESDLAAALAEEQFFLLYQPIFDLPSRSIVGVEALIRWRHPLRGVVAPDSFIPLAEASGMIVPIGRWVLGEAGRQAAEWSAAGLDVGMFVNVSAYQLARKGFAEEVRTVLERAGIEPHSLTLEITETTFVRDVPQAREQLQAIRAIGAHIAIDDFGTGYASLANLQGMPVDTLKIDRSFIAAAHNGEGGRELLEAILGVGRTLSLAVVAEGIEDDEQLSALEELGCQRAQGFLLARPSSAEDIAALLSARSSQR